MIAGLQQSHRRCGVLGVFGRKCYKERGFLAKNLAKGSKNGQFSKIGHLAKGPLLCSFLAGYLGRARGAGAPREEKSPKKGKSKALFWSFGQKWRKFKFSPFFRRFAPKRPLLCLFGAKILHRKIPRCHSRLGAARGESRNFSVDFALRADKVKWERREGSVLI